jgi:hypothetical protein
MPYYKYLCYVCPLQELERSVKFASSGVLLPEKAVKLLKNRNIPKNVTRECYGMLQDNLLIIIVLYYYVTL